MAKFNEQKFRDSAKAAGYSDEEIDAELKNTSAPAGAAVPNIAPVADGRETTAAYSAEAEAKQNQLVQEATKEKEATLAAPTFDWKSVANSPVGYVTGGAALGALASGVGYAFGKAKSSLSGINDRKIGTKPEIDKTIDIPMDTVEKRNVSPFAQQFETTYGVPLSTAEQLTGGPITNAKDAAIIGGALKNQGGISVNNPYQTSPYTQAPSPEAVAPTASAPQAAAPTSAPVAPPPSVQAGVENGSPAKAVQSVIAQEIDKTSGMYRDAQGNMVYPEKMSPAARAGYEAFTKQYPDIAKKLEEEKRFGILGGGSGDNSLNNSYNSDLAKKIRNEILGGQMVGTHGGEGGFYNATVTPAIKAIPPTTELGKEIAQLPEKGGTHGNLGTPATIGGAKGGLLTGANTVLKGLKAGGPALLLMSMADAAKAAQQGKYGEAAVRGADIATDYMPMISQLKQGLAPAEAGAPGVSKQTIENAYKLGSPYAQTEEAKKARLKEKAGAGRGIAPPSAYMR